MRQLAALLLVTACGGGDDYAIDPDHPPDHPPPGVHDAAVADTTDATDAQPDATALIAGRVCLFSDARAFTTCQAAGAGGFVVTLGSSMATTAADGTFSIAMPAGAPTNLLWHVTAASLQTSVMRFAEGNLIPAMTSDAYNTLEDNNGVASMQLGTGAVLAQVIEAGAKVKGAIVDATPQQLYATFYDGTTAAVWLQTATGAAGVAWIPDATVGSLTAKATYMTQTASAVLPIEDQAITYTALVLP